MRGTTGKVTGTVALAGVLALSGCSDDADTDVDTGLEEEQIEEDVERFGVPGEEEPPDDDE